MNHKSFSVPVFNIKSGNNDRIVTGVASVIGNIDAVGDVVAPGAFRKAVADFNAGKSRARFLWNHNTMEPPIAKILEIKEVGRDQLPAAVLAKDPTAQGGLVVKRQYLRDEFSDRIYQGIKSGTISEMSFAYDTKKSRYEDRPDGKRVHVLEELELFDLSDVNFGANAATVAAGAKGRRGRAIDPRTQRRIDSLNSPLSASTRNRIDRIKAFAGALGSIDRKALEPRVLVFQFEASALFARQLLARG